MFKKSKTIAALALAALMIAGVQQTAEAAARYVLTLAGYEIRVDGIPYADKDLPALSYNGSTYVPLRKIGELLGDKVAWNTAAKRVEITPDIPLYANPAFRVTSVTGKDGKYVISGQGRIFEAVMSYRVIDGTRVLLDKNLTLSSGAPSWASFRIELTVPKEQLPKDGTLHIELYEVSMKDGKPANVLPVFLQTW
ncbi:Gmad2 immunoglobulin-like domain-containing protein [Gorillibacterium sp. CAU 1737]|uniref:Gmad2 immunoglobulin-like domain-containing protein n=1 Tax=Gorillibacterium sp. CAU 1737 TaxID=3140362 RepID=UPI00325FEFA4